MGYRHRPLSSRLGLGFDPSQPHWHLEMPQAECFMYLVAHLNQLFGRGFSLYVEARHLAPEVLALYQAHPFPQPEAIRPVLLNPGSQRLHVAMGAGLAKEMNPLAACKTFSEMGEVMLVYAQGKVWMDGSRLDERVLLLAGDLPESKVRRLSKPPLHGLITWLET